MRLQQAKVQMTSLVRVTYKLIQVEADCRRRESHGDLQRRQPSSEFGEDGAPLMAGHTAKICHERFKIPLWK